MPRLTRHALIATLTTAAVIALGVGLAGADKDRGKRRQTRYIGTHPIAKGHGGGLCYIEAPHVHVYEAPSAKLQFRQHDDAYIFAGDPVAYGWDGPRHTYVGHHPLYFDAVIGVDEPDDEFCFLDGPHFHAFAPPATVSADFRVDADAYFFIGTPPPTYVEVRPVMAEVNAVYQPIEYQRPVVTVTPPSAWIGVRFPVVVVEGRGRARGHGRGEVHGHGAVGVDVVLPSVRVDVALPSVEIGVGAGVFIGGSSGGGHKHKGKRGKGRKHDD
jgi:hypothetical protein